MLCGGIRVHVPHEQHVAIRLAVHAVDRMVKRPIPRDHLALVPLVLLPSHKQPGVGQISGHPEVDIQNVVGRATVGFHCGAGSHSKEHHLLVLVDDVGKTRLGGEPLLQQSAKFRKKLLTLGSELLGVVQQDSIPGAIEVQKSISVLEVVGILGHLIKLPTNNRIILLQLAADRQSIPSVPRPHRHGPHPLQPNLGGVVHPGPGDSLSRRARGGPVVRQSLRLLKQLLSLLRSIQVLQLQKQNLVVQHRTPALQIIQVVKIRQALGVTDELASEIQAGHHEGPVSLVGVKHFLHHIQIQEQMRHITQGEKIV
mmetsp:Transcript_47202/g.102743  ORF Transcript_47202/g.102743 Transcript_47202/m.102743 type:complete len:312 (-) Transcript_47202:309-1244(-)